MTPRVYIVVPVHNRRDATNKCLLCIRQQTYQTITAVVVDDGSCDGTAELIEADFPEVVLLRGDGNLWWTAATNMGVEWALRHCASGDFVLTLNDDTEFGCDYIARLVRTAMVRAPSLVGSLCVDDGPCNAVVDAGVKVNWVTARYTWLQQGRSLSQVQTGPDMIQEVDVLSGRGTLVPSQAYREVGVYDARHLPHYAADYEFSRRAARARYALLIDYVAVVRTKMDPYLSNPGGRRLTVPVVWHLLTSRRSRLNVLYKLRYARLVCPWYAVPSYVVCDFTRVVYGAVAARMRKVV